MASKKTDVANFGSENQFAWVKFLKQISRLEF